MKWVARDSVKEFVDENAELFSSAMSEFIVRHSDFDFENVLIIFANDTMDYSDEPGHNLNRQTPDGIITNGEHIVVNGYWDETRSFVASTHHYSHIIGVFVNISKHPRSVKNCVNSLWHELTHVVQHKSGTLKISESDVLWHNKILITTSEYNEFNLTDSSEFHKYSELPWEIEARAAGKAGADWYLHYKISEQYGLFGKLINMVRKWF